MKKQSFSVYRLFNPGAAVTLLIAVPSFTLMGLCLAEVITHPVLTAVFYFFAAYALVICITLTVRAVKKLKRAVLNSKAFKRLLATKFGSRFFGNVAFRTKIFLYQGFCVNLLFFAVNIYSAARQRSLWFAFLALYYMMLAAMRLAVLRKTDKPLTMRQELSIYRACGIMLLLTNQVLTAIAVTVVTSGGGFNYRGSLIYAAALFAFYNIIVSSTNVIKFKKYKRPSLSAAKVINFTAAVVSMFALETAMLSRFSTEADRELIRVMIPVSAAMVCTGVLVIAVYMTVRSAVLLKNMTESEVHNDEQQKI